MTTYLHDQLVGMDPIAFTCWQEVLEDWTLVKDLTLLGLSSHDQVVCHASELPSRPLIWEH